MQCLTNMFLLNLMIFVKIVSGFRLFNYPLINKNASERGSDNSVNYQRCCPENFVYSSSVHACQSFNHTNNLGAQNYLTKLVNYKVVEDCEVDNIENDIELANVMFAPRKLPTAFPSAYCVANGEKTVIRKFYDNVDICQEKRCIKKCCPDGYSFINDTKCAKSYHYGLNISQWTQVTGNSIEPYAIIYNSSCGNLQMLNEELQTFTVDEKGVFHLTINGYRYMDNVSMVNSYCSEHFINETHNGVQFFICADRLEEHYIYFLYPLSLSCVFLVLTIIIYVYLGETKKLFGKILVSYNLAILFWFGQVVFSIITERSITEICCKIEAFFSIFARSACITWLNVLCWDIWLTFRSTKGSMDNSAQIKKLLVYSFYGWGVPVLLMLIILFFSIWNTILPEIIQPYLEKGRCVYETKPGNYAEPLFFNLPLVIIQATSLILFIRTVMHCIKIKNEIKKMSDDIKDDKLKKYRRDQDKLLMVLKLGIIMGVTFVFEMVASFFTDLYLKGDIVKYTEIIFNCINASQGILIFFIFIFKKRILRKCLGKIKYEESQRNSVSSVSTTASNDSFHSSNSLKLQENIK